MPPSLAKDPVSWLYPEIEPFRTGMLDVGDGHELYYEECGASDGKPVVFLHGGPGAGTGPKHRRFFHPERYRIVLFHQRGCGRSTRRGPAHFRRKRRRTAARRGSKGTSASRTCSG